MSSKVSSAWIWFGIRSAILIIFFIVGNTIASEVFLLEPKKLMALMMVTGFIVVITIALDKIHTKRKAQYEWACSVLSKPMEKKNGCR